MKFQFGYVILLFALFIVPRFLQRYRIPNAVTCFVIGILCGPAFHLVQEDSTIKLLSIFGISSLFLFAGLEVDLKELKIARGGLFQHTLIALLALVGCTYLFNHFFWFNLRISSLISLALLTPSAGFILNSISVLDMDSNEKFWIKSKAISAELLALTTFFFALQSTSWVRLGASSAALLSMILLVPLLFRAFAVQILPFAPKSEFAFLMMVAVMCAYTTKELGVYYLIGAFIVGLAAQRMRERLPAVSSEKMLDAVELFSSFFIPFYFFYAGMEVPRESISWMGFLYGIVFSIVFLPFRAFIVAAHRRLSLSKDEQSNFRVSLWLLPTLVFTLVISSILREQFAIDNRITFGLIVYAVVNTALAPYIFKFTLPSFDEPKAQDIQIQI